MSSARVRRLRHATGGLALAALLGGVALPLLEAAFTPEAAAFCGKDGRCCCMGSVKDAGEGPCLLRSCGCGRPDDANVSSARPRIEAVLPSAAVPAPPARRGFAPAEPPTPLLGRPHAPPVPPPRHALSA
jgi:hypothetical protein